MKKLLPNTFTQPPSSLFKSALVASTIAVVSLFFYDRHRNLTNLYVMEKQLSETRTDLLGYTTFTAYLNESKKAITEQTKFLAAKVDRDYVHVQHIQKTILGFRSEATIILKYTVEYSFGFDLRPDRYTLTGDTNGMIVTLDKPELVAAPSVRIVGHEIPSAGFLVDEKTEIIELQRQLLIVAENRAKDIQQEEAVKALCEKKLGEFLRDFLARQPSVRAVPIIKFSYK